METSRSGGSWSSAPTPSRFRTWPAEREPLFISPTIRGAASSVRAPSPGRTQIRDRTPVIFTESDTHGPTPNVVMAGFIGTPSQWERFDKRLAKLQRRHGFSTFRSTELKSRRGDFAGDGR